MPTTRSFLSSAVALLASATLFQHVAAQVTTDCQPLNTTNCPADPAFGMDFNFNFNATPSAWETTVGPVTFDDTNGASFTISKQGDSPTIRSTFYIFFGRIELWIKAAAGTGIISSVMLLSDDLDEIDWEFMGGNHTHVETNYFGKGRQDFHNAIYYPVDNGIIDDFHNYTTHWTSDALDFYVDGQLVRTLLPKDANSTFNYPQTPMRIAIGIWAGGDPTLPEGTREWAGGDTNYDEGPFNMYVKSAHVTDYSEGKEYTYGDMSGTYESIKITSGNSTAKDQVTAVPEVTESLSDKWNKLSQTSKIAIYASSAGVGAILVAFMAFYCVKQRRRGAREARAAEARYNDEQRELAAFRAAGINPDSLEAGTEYNAKEMSRGGLSNQDSYSVPNTPGSPERMEEKWQTAVGAGAGAGAAAAAAAAGTRNNATMPLLREMSSPGPQTGSTYDRSMYNASPAQSAAPFGNPMRSQSPAVSPPQQQQFGQPPSRSFTAPTPQMRVGSPAPLGPNPMMVAAPQPQRSFTTAGAYNPPSFGLNEPDQYWGGNNNGGHNAGGGYR